VTQIDDPECTERLVDTTVAPSFSGLVTIPISLPFGRYRVCVDDGVDSKTSSSFTPDALIPSDHDLTPGQILDSTDAVVMTDPLGLNSGECP
jgi:hypothetical protein